MAKAASRLPEDAERACLVGRAWRPDRDGPSVVTVRDGQVIDITRAAHPTVRDLVETGEAAAIAGRAEGEAVGAVSDLLANSDETARDAGRPWLLAPVDLQAVKASGVTFVVSLLERVIEEQARGDAGRAAKIRDEIGAVIGDDLSMLEPGSERAMEAEGPSRRAQRLVAISRGRHRAGRGDLHQGAADERRRHRRARRPPPVEPVEQPGARGRRHRGRVRPHRRRDAWQRREPARRRGAAPPSSSARPRTTTRPPRSAPSSASSTTASRSTTCAAPSCRCMSRARTASRSTGTPRCARSAVTRPTSSPPPSTRIINIRTGWRSISAPCSRR